MASSVGAFALWLQPSVGLWVMEESQGCTQTVVASPQIQALLEWEVESFSPGAYPGWAFATGQCGSISSHWHFAWI